MVGDLFSVRVVRSRRQRAVQAWVGSFPLASISTFLISRHLHTPAIGVKKEAAVLSAMRPDWMVRPGAPPMPRQKGIGLAGVDLSLPAAEHNAASVGDITHHTRCRPDG